MEDYFCAEWIKELCFLAPEPTECGTVLPGKAGWTLGSVAGPVQPKVCPGYPHVSFQTQDFPPSTLFWVTQGSQIEIK